MEAALRQRDVIAAIDEVIARFDPLGHPFYVAWSSGSLARADLARHAAAQRWPVLALAATAELTGDCAYAREELEQVALWEQFAAACGAGPGEPTVAAADCALTWLSGRDRVERLAVLYATESAQAAIAPPAIAGLLDHYGFELGTATDYFVVCAQRCAAHAEAARLGLLAAARPCDAERLVECVEAALGASWRLLDEVQAA